MDFNKNFLIHCPLHKNTTTAMAPSNQPSPAEMRKQVEEMRRVWEAREREEREKEEALLRAAEKEEEWEAERKQQEEEENNSKRRPLRRQSRNIGSKGGGWTSHWKSSSGINRGKGSEGR